MNICRAIVFQNFHSSEKHYSNDKFSHFYALVIDVSSTHVATEKFLWTISYLLCQFLEPEKNSHYIPFYRMEALDFVTTF